MNQLFVSYLITGGTAGLEHLSIMSAAVDASIFVEVNQIHQEVVTNLANKASWVPTPVLSCTRCKHSNLPEINVVSTSITNLQRTIMTLTYKLKKTKRLNLQQEIDEAKKHQENLAQFCSYK